MGPLHDKLQDKLKQFQAKSEIKQVTVWDRVPQAKCDEFVQRLIDCVSLCPECGCRLPEKLGGTTRDWKPEQEEA